MVQFLFRRSLFGLLHADSDSNAFSRNLIMIPSRNIENAFSILDSNQSGSLDSKELNRLVKHLNHRQDVAFFQDSENMNREKFIEIVEGMRNRLLREEFEQVHEMTIKKMLEIFLRLDKNFDKDYK
jgi:Ca2+-binding EF-hand superfamily protein